MSQAPKAELVVQVEAKAAWHGMRFCEIGSAGMSGNSTGKTAGKPEFEDKTLGAGQKGGQNSLQLGRRQ